MRNTPAIQLQPNSTPHILYLDGWRGIAILLVFLGHFFQLKGINDGALGVDFFFVLSGRLMADILFIRKTPLLQFFLRRFSRIYPGLLIFVLIATAAFAATSLHVGLLATLSALTFTINYAVIYFHRTGIFDHLWSLCVEEHTYVILGFMAYLSRRFGFPAIASMLIISLLAIANGFYQLTVLHHNSPDVYWRTDVQIASILLGAWFYILLKRGYPTWLAKMSPIFIFIAILFKTDTLIPAISFGISAACLSIAVSLLDTSPQYLKKFLSFSPLRKLGIWSYSLYLWQQPFYKLHILGYIYWPLPAAIICGLLSFYLIEQPARNFLNFQIQKLKT